MRITRAEEQRAIIVCMHAVCHHRKEVSEPNSKPTAVDCCRQMQTFADHAREDRLWPRKDSLLAETLGFTPRPPSHEHGSQAVHCSTCKFHSIHRKFSERGAVTANAKLIALLSHQEKGLDHSSKSKAYDPQDGLNENELLRESIVAVELVYVPRTETSCRAQILASETREFQLYWSDFQRFLFSNRIQRLMGNENVFRLRIEFEMRRVFEELLSVGNLARCELQSRIDFYENLSAAVAEHHRLLRNRETFERLQLELLEASFSVKLLLFLETTRKGLIQKTSCSGLNGLGKEVVRGEVCCLTCHDPKCEFFRNRWRPHWAAQTVKRQDLFSEPLLGGVFERVRPQLKTKEKKVTHSGRDRAAPSPARPSSLCRATAYARAPFRCGTPSNYTLQSAVPAHPSAQLKQFVSA